MTPLPLKAPDVQALLNGAIKLWMPLEPQPGGDVTIDNDLHFDSDGRAYMECVCHGRRGAIKLPHAPGDVVFVQEEWAELFNGVVYAIDGEYPPTSKWRPADTMPERASRLHLRIVDVKVMRACDISDVDGELSDDDADFLFAADALLSNNADAWGQWGALYTVERVNDDR